MIGSAFNLEVVDARRRLVPSKMPSRFRARALDWAHRIDGRESLKTAWDVFTSRIVFYRMKNGEPQVYCEADLCDQSSFQRALRDARLGKERMIVKKLWQSWSRKQSMALREKILQQRDDNEYKELLSRATWNQAVRDGGRKRRRSHLVEINPLVVK